VPKKRDPETTLANGLPFPYSASYCQGFSWNKSLKVVILATVYTKLTTLAALLILALIVAYKSPMGSDSLKRFEIKKGDSLATIGQTLKRVDVVDSEVLFAFFARLSRKAHLFKAGEYETRGRISFEALFELLCKGATRDILFTLPEGFNRFDIASELRRQGFRAYSTFLADSENLQFATRLALPIPAKVSLEGFLFPDTYSIPRNIASTQLIRVMTRVFAKKWEALKGSNHSHLEPYELLTLASLVEKETGAPEERARIAGVFYNRLKKKMRLQSDPTIIYGLLPNFSGNLTRKDILTPHPWNTYTLPALPETPICNPGLDALEAAMNPEQHDFLYFVSHNDGTHEFTATYEAHQQAVRNFQLNPKAREGKSWRQLKQKTQ